MHYHNFCANYECSRHIFLPCSDKTWTFSRKPIFAAIFLATFFIVQNMVISTIFNCVCFDYLPPLFPSYLHSQSGGPYAFSMQQEYEATFCDDWIPDFISIFKKKGFKLLRIWAGEKKHSKIIFDLSRKSLFLYFNEAREQMESSSSILSPIFLAEHHSPEYLSMSLFRFLNSWKVWKEKKGEEYQFLAAVSPWRVSSRAKWGNNNTSREGKHVISNLSNLLVSITKILQRCWYRWKSVIINTPITGKENLRTTKVWLPKC